VDGIQLVQEIRATPQGPRIPIILVSARAGEEARIEGLLTGADDYLVKPFSARELMARVEGQLQLAQLRRDFDRSKQEAQARYARMLRRSNEELQQFTYIVSHDLQEPLRTITSYLQLLEKRYASQLDNDGREFLNFAVDGAARMKELINDLLTLSRIEGSEKALEEVSVQSALDRALANLQQQIEAKKAIITQDAMPTLKVDGVQLTQVFQNLISNAIKFQPGQVPEVHIGVEHKGDEWKFYVRDNGIGIAPEHRERIFMIFQRLHLVSEYPGTGVGLAICKKVVERHGGRIWVESTVGEGTTFYFTLPS
jgi:light-regulated signal transduction histidine kinase (bacteriophytochrome)